MSGALTDAVNLVEDRANLWRLAKQLKLSQLVRENVWLDRIAGQADFKVRMNPILATGDKPVDRMPKQLILNGLKSK